MNFIEQVEFANNRKNANASVTAICPSSIYMGV